MAYEPQEWADGVEGGTPLSADRLNHLEAGVASAHAPHTHAASEVDSGTFSAARIPALAISKVTGLQAALDGKQESGDYATAAALADLVSRVEALESAAGG